MLFRVLDTIMAAVAAAFVAATAVCICLNVFYRYVLESGLVWADEVPGYFLVWISFIGAYLAVRSRGHISFDMVVEKLPPAARRIAATLVDLLIIGFLALLLVLSLRMIAIVGDTEIETADIPQGLFMTVLPIACTAMIAALAAAALRRHRK